MGSSQKNIKFLDARSAGKLVGYSSDYVTRLAREKKIAAVQTGRQWLIDIDSLKLFSLSVQAEKRERAEKIREERRVELAKAAFVTEVGESDSLAEEISNGRPQAVVETAIAAVAMFLVFNMLWFSYENRLSGSELLAGVGMITDHIQSVVWQPAVASVSQVASYAFIDTPAESTIQVDEIPSEKTPGFEGIVVVEEAVVSEEQIEAIRESFSDEVEVEFTEADSGVITPVFSEREGERYRFVVTPIRQADQ